VPEQEQGDKQNEIQNFDPDCEEVLKGVEPAKMEVRNPTCKGEAKDHDEKIEEFVGFNQKLSAIDHHVSNQLARKNVRIERTSLKVPLWEIYINRKSVFDDRYRKQ